MQLSLHSVSQTFGFQLAMIADNSSEAEMIAYGLEIFLGSLFKIAVLFTSALIFGITSEVALILLVTGSLRTLSGGAHCTAYYRCMLASTIIMIALGAIIKGTSNLLINLTILLAFLLSVSIYLYWRYSPQAPLNKPLPDRTAERKFRFMTVGLALFYSVISLSPGTSSWISWCIAIGLLWQALTLTGLGHKLVTLFDNLLNFKKGGVPE